MEDCLFCQIVAGKIPAEIVYRDDEVVAFRDINPQAPVHVLVIPHKHIPTFGDLTGEDDVLMGHVLRAAARIADEEGVRESGYRSVVNAGPDANQSVPHLHVHVIGGRRMGWPPG
jgi:histidine triad (HIT) family protein